MILVTGGTGLVGSHLLQALVRDGRPVRAIKRASSDMGMVRRVFDLYSPEPEKDSLADRMGGSRPDGYFLPGRCNGRSGGGISLRCDRVVSPGGP